MKNRITHLLKDWNPEGLAVDAPADRSSEPSRIGYPLPRGINTLMPAELCINRELLMTLLSANIQEMQRHKRSYPSPGTDLAMAELEAALQQQLAFRAWVREHPANYISIALYPTTGADTAEDLGDG
jgi:hypothetical protein